MLRRRTVPVVAVAALAASLALAGQSGTKCTMTTQDCLNHMAAQMKSAGFVGVELNRDDATGTLTVTKVIPGTPAEAAGIQAGDVLYALNGVVISKASEKELEKARKDWAPGQSVTYTIKRDGNESQVTLTLAPMPADVMAKYIGQHMLEHAAIDAAKDSSARSASGRNTPKP